LPELQYREFFEVTDEPGGPYVVEIRLCHEFPVMPLSGSNQVVVLDPAVAGLMCATWAERDMPTDTWGVMVC
jgi:hypothetical protein